MELARRIREKDKKVLIAFLSNNRGYVFEGYEVQAARYLSKPASKEQLFPLLRMAQDAIKQDKLYIIIGGASDKFKLATDEIYYVEAIGHYVKIHTEQKEYEVKMNMNELSGQLGSGFIMPHRSFLVNLFYVERITKTDCVLTGDLPVPISRNSYKEVNQDLFILFTDSSGELHSIHFIHLNIQKNNIKREALWIFKKHLFRATIGSNLTADIFLLLPFLY
jgi:DNA-binding LytR/AlgR family response regulator